MDLNYLDYGLILLIINIIDNIAVILTVIYSLRYNDRQCSLTQSKEYNTQSYRLCYQGGVYWRDTRGLNNNLFALWLRLKIYW